MNFAYVLLESFECFAVYLMEKGKIVLEIFHLFLESIFITSIHSSFLFMVKSIMFLHPISNTFLTFFKLKSLNLEKLFSKFEIIN